MSDENRPAESTGSSADGQGAAPTAPEAAAAGQQQPASEQPPPPETPVPPPPPPPGAAAALPPVPPPPPASSLRTGEPQDGSPEDEEREKLIFRSDLNEVYLLLDFISGRPERNLDGLTMRNPDNPNELWGSGTIVQKIMQIRYPPKGPQEEVAKEATMLLMAKDQLSRLAWPARADTIAYTAMYVEEKGRGIFGRSGRNPPAQARPSAPEPANPAALDHSLGRLARDTFPHFEGHVRRFLCFRNFLFILGALLLLLTAMTSWDVAHGRDVVGRIDQIEKELDTAYQANARLAEPNFCPPAQPGGPGRADSAKPAPTGTADTAKPAATGTADTAKPATTGNDNDAAARLGCKRVADLLRNREVAYVDLDRVFGCDGTSCKGYWHTFHWGWLLSSGRLQARTSDMTGGPGSGPHLGWQSVNSVLTVFSGYILPLLYGLLGTLVGAFRSVQDKARNAELGPRDHGLIFAGMLFGMVAGLVVGIFMSTGSVPAPGGGNAVANVTLTASGLAFLAGYASQSFFRFIDDVIAKVFPSDAPAAPAVVSSQRATAAPVLRSSASPTEIPTPSGPAAGR